jgi:hypothetical protein
LNHAGTSSGSANLDMFNRSSAVRFHSPGHACPQRAWVCLGCPRQPITAGTNVTRSSSRHRRGSMVTSVENKMPSNMGLTVTARPCGRATHKQGVCASEPRHSVVLHSIVGNENLEQLSHFLLSEGKPSFASPKCIALLESGKGNTSRCWVVRVSRQ